MGLLYAAPHHCYHPRVIGQTLSHYKILDKLGEGGMGEVYRARDTKLDRDVALKVLPADLASDPDRRMRFDREAKAVAALLHPNIVMMFSIEEADGVHFLTMELVEGRPLNHLIPESGLTLDKFFDLAIPLTDAVSSAHFKSIVHRDLKPANIMVNEKGHIKVLDFGLAKLLEADLEADETMGPDSDTAKGQILGTVAYMSPEQAQGEKIDQRTDVFALGVILYEMTTGKRPFHGKNNISTISAILKDTPQSVTDLNQSLPRHLGRIINKCLAKAPDRRYQSVLDLRNDLRDLEDEVASDVSSSSLRLDTVSSIEPAGDSGQAASDSSVISSITSPAARKVVIPAAVIVVAIVLFLIFNPFSVELKKERPAVAAESTVGVIGFENLSDPGDEEHLGRMLMGLITTDLTESGGLSVVSTSKVLTAHKEVGGDIAERFDPTLATETARRAGATTMLTGQVMQSGDKLLLTAELVDVESGNNLGSFKKEAASGTELFDLAGSIAADVRDRLGAGEAAASDHVNLAQTLTDSPEAYRQYSAGQIALSEGSYAQAARLFGQAARHDSTFALAWHRLSVAQEWNGDTDAGIKASDRAVRHMSRLPKRWQVVVQAQNNSLGGNVDEAYEALNELIDTTSDVPPDGYNTLGEILTHYSRYLHAKRNIECFEQALDADPTFKVVFFHLVSGYAYRGDFAAAEKLIARYEREDPSDPQVIDAKWRLEFHRRNYAKVRDGLHDIQDLRAQDLRSESLLHLGQFERGVELWNDWKEVNIGYQRALSSAEQADFHSALGQFQKSHDGLKEAIDGLRELGGGSWAAIFISNFLLSQSRLLELTGDIEGALEFAGQARTGDRFDPRPYATQGRLLIGAGRSQEAAKVLGDLKTMMAESFSPWPEYWLHLLEAELRLAGGDVDSALVELEKAAALRWTNGDLTFDAVADLLLRARILEAQGDNAGAIAAYESVFAPPYHAGEWTIHNLTVRYDLGRLYEAEGDVAAARDHYQAYVDTWGEADTPVANMADAKSRLAALNVGN